MISWVGLDQTAALSSSSSAGYDDDEEAEEEEEGGGGGGLVGSGRASHAALCLQLQLAHVLHTAETWDHATGRVEP